MKVISKSEQEKIIRSIRAFCTTGKKVNLKRVYLMVVGVYIALGQATPPHWVINIHCGRVDRLMEEFIMDEG